MLLNCQSHLCLYKHGNIGYPISGLTPRLLGPLGSMKSISIVGKENNWIKLFQNQTSKKYLGRLFLIIGTVSLSRLSFPHQYLLFIALIMDE